MRAMLSPIRPPQRRAGFTLAETLVAMGVFVLGFIAVAALFPAAALLQKQTMDQVQTKQFKTSVKAIFGARKFLGDDLLNKNGTFVRADPDTSRSVDESGQVHALVENPIKDMYGGITLRDRAWPANAPILPNPLAGRPNEPDVISAANFFYLPLVQDANPEPDVQQWQVFVMILRRQGDAIYTAGTRAANQEDPNWVPVVNNRPATKSGVTTINVTNNDEFTIGDKVLGNNGMVFTITKVDGDTLTVNSFIPDDPPLNSIWFAKPGTGNRSPLRDIVLLAGEDAVIP